MLTVREAFDDLLLLLYIEDADNAPDYIRNQVLGDIQAAVQMMASCGEDYFGRTTITQALTAGTSSYLLEEQVQTVLDPLRIDPNPPLRKLATRAEAIAFPQLYLESLSQSVAAGRPIAWFLESLNPAYSGAAESVALTLHLLPAPDQTYSLKLDAILQPPNFVLADLCNDAKYIPVPHQYTESIFLPLARWQVTTHTWFTATEKIPQLEKDYLRALALLGVNDPRRPQPDGVGHDSLRLPAPDPQQKEAA